MSAFLLTFLIALQFPVNVFAQQNVTLRAGVIHAPPMAFVSDDGVFSGLQLDLLERVKTYAMEDGIDLEVVLDRASSNYGEAFDLIANDCDPDESDCDKYDMLIGDYQTTPSRFARADFTPSYMQVYISASKYLEGTKPTYSTFSQANASGAAVCTPEGTYVTSVLQERFSGVDFLECPSFESCIADLKSEACSLYAEINLRLLYLSMHDSTTEKTREEINRNYLAWPMKYSLDAEIRTFMKRWIYRAVQSSAVDELYSLYYEPKTCPLGFAGPTCEEYCDPDHGLADTSGSCICDSTKWTGVDCSIELDEDQGLIPSWQKVLGYLMFGINMTLVILCGIWVVCNRKKPQVKVAQPFFLMLLLLGCSVSSGTILALMQEAEDGGTTEYCMAIPWLYSVGFSITFGTLFAKVYRIHKIFSSANRMRKVQMDLKTTLFWIALVLFVDVAILLSWQLTDPLRWERDEISIDKFGNVLSSVGMCVSQHWEVFAGLIAFFHFSVMGVASYMCYATRHVPARINDGNYAAMALFSNLQILLIGVPVVMLVGADPDTTYFLRSAIVWMNDLVVIVIIFGHIIFTVSSNASGRKSMRSMVRQSIQEYISAEKQSHHSPRNSRCENNSGSSTLNDMGSGVNPRIHAALQFSSGLSSEVNRSIVSNEERRPDSKVESSERMSSFVDKSTTYSLDNEMQVPGLEKSLKEDVSMFELEEQSPKKVESSPEDDEGNPSESGTLPTQPPESESDVAPNFNEENT